jgi:hypothetical protein
VDSQPHERTGGDVLVETLRALGATCVFGMPGQHALGAFDALRRSGLDYIGCRNELNAGFAADGYARVAGKPGVLLVSTGPGALATLAALQEAAASSSPVVAIGSQIPRAALGGRRKGFLHELRDQKSSFRDIVKAVELASEVAQIPSALTAAWKTALTPPCGPVWIEIPQDVLLERARIPPIGAMSVEPSPPIPRPELIAEAVRILDLARRPVIIAGGGVVRARAKDDLLRLAERGVVTAGSSSPLSDGAAAVIVASERALSEYALVPRARVVASASAGVAPNVMGLGPVPATQKVLAKVKWSIDQLGSVELNEAFAAQSLAVVRRLGLDEEIVNADGGTIALGHPLGCSGARITFTLLGRMEREKVSRGIATLCVGVGQGVAMLVERP